MSSAAFQLPIHDVPPPLPIVDVATTIASPPHWLATLPWPSRQATRMMAVATLTEHQACSFLPFRPASLELVRRSIADHGVMFPLGVTEQGQVLDGRYRLRAAKALGLTELPVIAVDPPDPEKFVFEAKNSREHLSDTERAVLAVQYQRHKSAAYIAERTEKMNAARDNHAKTEPAAPPPTKALPKFDSRKEACAKFRVPERKFRAIHHLAEYRPDLFAKVVDGTLPAETAIKQRGKNVVKHRVAAAQAQHVRPEDVVEGSLENGIHVGEAAAILKRVSDATASLMLFSPPYHGVQGIDYDPPVPEQSYEQYLAGIGDVLREGHRVSRSGGRLAIVLDTVANPLRHNARHTMLPVVADVTRLAIDCGWDFGGDIAWCKDEIGGTKTSFGSLALCSAPHFGRNHEWILLLHKDAKKLKGDKTLCDLTREEHLAWWVSTWKIPPETRSFVRDHHPAPFPEEIDKRLIKLLTYRRDVVIDPFNGSGTTTAVAKRLNRRYIGIDRSPKYCAFAVTRLIGGDAPPSAQEITAPSQTEDMFADAPKEIDPAAEMLLSPSEASRQVKTQPA